MTVSWRLRYLGLFLLAVTGCNNAVTVDEPPPVPEGNRAPVIVIDAPTKIAKGRIVQFDASQTTDPEGDAIEFFWEESDKNPVNNFFEGLTLTDPRIQMLVNVEGTFTYTLLAKDSEGNESSSAVTLTVTPVPGASPVLTGVKINGITYDLETTPSPTVFTTATKVLSVIPIGTDVDSPDTMTAHYGKPIVNGFYTAPNMLDDPDGFRTVTATVWLEDPEEHTSVVKTITFRIVPKATKDLTPRALHVNCALATNGTGSTESPFNSIQSAYTAAAQIAQVYRPDLYVAAGTCTESVQVDYSNVNLYGLFEPANGWTRRMDIGTSTTSRFLSPTIVSNPDAESLLYTTSPSGTGTLLIDGITFKLDGNFYGIDITSPGSENEKVTIQNSEFIGLARASVNDQVGGGIRVKQGPSVSFPTVDGAKIVRNLFSVGAADNGSRFQVWATHKGNPADASRKKHFHSNVFYGGIGFSTTYSCGEETQKPFAFCLYKTAGETNNTFDSWSHATRNLFWITAGNTSVNATVLTSGGGHLRAVGNVFRSTAPASNPVVFMQSYKSTGSDYIGDFSFNAFPVYAANVSYVVDSNPSPNSYNCLDTSITPVRLGMRSGATCGSPLEPPGAIGYIDQSYVYASLTAGSPYVWRFSGNAFRDKTLNGAAPDPAVWDFDGRYGVANDDTVSSSNEYNSGPFESAATTP